MPLDPIETLQQLVRIPSVNPMGRGPADSACGESRLTDFLQDKCQQLGWGWLRQRVHPGRENLVAVVPGYPAARDGGELLLWDVHQDTIAVEGMTVDPFAAELRDGRVSGRGACDVKGSMAAILAALSRITEPPAEQVAQDVSPAPRPTVVVAFTVNEECGFTGAQALCHLWAPGSVPRDTSIELGIAGGTVTPPAVFPRAPDAAIVAEPTDLNVVVAHQGMVRWRCHTTGRAAHSSRPDEGVNAIYAMAAAVQVIEKYHAQLAASASEHPRCGRPSICVGTIHGGVGINTVPDRATIEIDRRVSPGDDPLAAYEELVEFIARHADVGAAKLAHDAPFMQSAGLPDTQNGPLAERLGRIVRDFGRPGASIGAPYGTDAAAIAASGVPTVVCGPGSIRQAHTADEFIEVSELELATRIFQDVATRGLR